MLHLPLVVAPIYRFRVVGMVEGRLNGYNEQLRAAYYLIVKKSSLSITKTRRVQSAPGRISLCLAGAQATMCPQHCSVINRVSWAARNQDSRHIVKFGV